MLVRDVVHDSVDARDLVRDPNRDPVEHIVGYFRIRRRHPVDRVDRPDGDGLPVHAQVAVDPHGLDREQHGKVLPREWHSLVLGRDLDLMLDDRRRLSHEYSFFRSDLYEYSVCLHWPWEWLPFCDHHHE